ncbi:MAG: hypothetical protein H7A32_01355 [Deltaproteobacteria bacterium]|nr:hypothetical protein [Deltaproteobacteria bacterium]
MNLSKNKLKVFIWLLLTNLFLYVNAEWNQSFAESLEKNSLQQDDENQKIKPMSQREKYLNRKFLFESSYIFSAHPSQQLYDDQGKINIYRHRFDWSFIYRINKKIIPGFSLNFEHSQYDLNNIHDFSMLDDSIMGQGMRLRFGPSLLIKVSDHWSTYLAFYPNFSLEYGADWGKSFRYSSVAFASYRFNPKIALRFGVLVIGSRPEAQTLIIPIIGFEWKPNKKWELGIGGVTDGPGIYTSYRINKKLQLRADASWVLHEFRLDNEGLIPGGVLEDMQVPIHIGVIYEPWPFFSINPYLGSNIWSRYQVLDAQGEDVKTVYGRPSLTGGIGINLKY